MAENMTDLARYRRSLAKDGEFVVDLNDLSLAVAELRNLISPTIALTLNQSVNLGLALIKFPDGTVQDAAAVAAASPWFQSKPDELAIDTVVRAIRESSRARYDRIPVMGKNRTLDGVHTSQHVGTGGDPTPPKAISVDVQKKVTDKLADRNTTSEVLPGSNPDRRPVVGVIDTGIWKHPQLDRRYWDEGDIYLDLDDPMAAPSGHGTFVCGMVLQGSPNVDLRIRKALGSEDGTALAWDVAEEMVRLGKLVDVLNLSFACFTEDDERPLLLARAVERIDWETVIVAAAGNYGEMKSKTPGLKSPRSPNSPMWPAAFERVIAVGAHGADKKRALFSPDAPWVNLTAFGVDVPSLYLEGRVAIPPADDQAGPGVDVYDGYAKWTGTSFAAARASGVIAGRIGKGPQGLTARQASDEIMHLNGDDGRGVWHFTPNN